MNFHLNRIATDLYELPAQPDSLPTTHYGVIGASPYEGGAESALQKKGNSIPDFLSYGQGNASSHMHGSGTGCTTRLVNNVNQCHCFGSTYFTLTVFTVILLILIL